MELLFLIVIRKILIFLPSKLYARMLGVKIGRNTMINTKNWSTEPYLVTIGNNCQITSDVWFHTHGGGHVVRHDIPDFDCFGEIIVEDDAYIGTGAQIMPGCRIGRGSLVAAGAIVTKSVPAYCVVAGAPAKVLCSVEDYMKRMESYNMHTNGMSWSQKKSTILKNKDRLIVKQELKW